MNKTLVKICGISDVNTAKQAVGAGANYIGLVFHAHSKRYIDINKAQEIAKIVKELGATPVAVFTNHSATQMQEICELTKIDTVQLHGSLSRQEHPLLPANYQRIYVRPVMPNGIVADDQELGLQYCDPKRDFLLFDTPQAGSGKTFAWQQFKNPEYFKWFLAGGLTPENVSIAINILNPTVVDVSSGVEIAGIKNIELIREFINNVRMKY